MSNVTNTSKHSAVCATPPDLDNAPVYMLPSIPSCDTVTDTSDYYYTYEYYHDNATETSLESFLLSTREVHYQRHMYMPGAQLMILTFDMDPDTKPFKCDLINVFKETSDGPLMKTAIPCDNNSVDSDSHTVNVSLSLDQHHLCSNEYYRYCVTFIHNGQIMPGCTIPIAAVETERPSVSISSLRGNVSVTHNMTVHVTSRVPGSQLSSSSVTISVSEPGQEPVAMEHFQCAGQISLVNIEDDINTSESCHESTDHVEYCNIEAIMADLPGYTYYNVCAELHMGNLESENTLVDTQCMILHSSTIVRYQTR